SLYRRRMFVDRRGEAYQFHDLFRAFLLDALLNSRAAAAVDALRVDAARILEAAGDIEPAFALACAASDWQVAGATLVRHAPMLFEQGRVPTLLAWLEALPAALVERTPWLGFWRAVTLSGRSPAQARAEFARVFEQFAPGVDDA